MKCFWAYSNHPHNVKNDVIDAINQINNSGIISIKPWETMDIEGNFIIDEILKEINACDVFVCELSNLNNNVLYELGYAIAKKKKIRIFINQNLKSVKEEFKSFSLLTSIGYVDYVNSSQMLNSLYKLGNDNEMDILSSIISGISVSNYSNLLYMKSFQDTSSSISLTRAIDELKLKLVVDDPKEVSAQTLDWYVTNLIACNGYVAHLQSTKYNDVKVHNAKVSLISGIALGLNIPMLMLVEEPFEAPTDYKDIIKTYTVKNECIK